MKIKSFKVSLERHWDPNLNGYAEVSQTFWDVYYSSEDYLLLIGEGGAPAPPSAPSAAPTSLWLWLLKYALPSVKMHLVPVHRRSNDTMPTEQSGVHHVNIIIY